MAISDKSKYLDHSRVIRLKRKLGIDLVQEHEDIKQNLTAIRFDGKTSYEAQSHSKVKRTHYITTVDGHGDYIDHFESKEGAEDISAGVFKVVQDTNSCNSLIAIGSGKK